jgi:hypothetical protein
MDGLIVQILQWRRVRRARLQDDWQPRWRIVQCYGATSYSTIRTHHRGFLGFLGFLVLLVLAMTAAHSDGPGQSLKRAVQCSGAGRVGKARSRRPISADKCKTCSRLNCPFRSPLPTLGEFAIHSPSEFSLQNSDREKSAPLVGRSRGWPPSTDVGCALLAHLPAHIHHHFPGSSLPESLSILLGERCLDGRGISSPWPTCRHQSALRKSPPTSTSTSTPRRCSCSIACHAMYPTHDPERHAVRGLLFRSCRVLVLRPLLLRLYHASLVMATEAFTI